MSEEKKKNESCHLQTAAVICNMHVIADENVRYKKYFFYGFYNFRGFKLFVMEVLTCLII